MSFVMGMVVGWTLRLLAERYRSILMSFVIGMVVFIVVFLFAVWFEAWTR